MRCSLCISRYLPVRRRSPRGCRSKRRSSAGSLINSLGAHRCGTLLREASRYRSHVGDMCLKLFLFVGDCMGAPSHRCAYIAPPPSVPAQHAGSPQEAPISSVTMRRNKMIIQEAGGEPLAPLLLPMLTQSHFDVPDSVHLQFRPRHSCISPEICPSTTLS